MYRMFTFTRNKYIRCIQLVNKNVYQQKINIKLLDDRKLNAMKYFYECYHRHHYDHVTLPARITLNLSRNPSQSSIAPGRSSRLFPVSAQSCCILVLAGRPAFSRPCEVVNRGISLMSSSLLLQQWPTCLVGLILIVFVMGVVGGRTATVLWVLPPGFVQYCSQHSYVIAVKLFLHTFC